MRAVETTPATSLNAGEELSLSPRRAVGDHLARPQGEMSPIKIPGTIDFLGHSDVKMTIIYIHALNSGPAGVRSPVDGL